MDNLRFKGARSAARIDNAVGDRIRRRRMLLGYTQEQLADALEISYQQIQKYETGANRVSAGRLFQIAQRLEAPIAYFFEGLGLEFDAEVSASNAGVSGGSSSRTTIEVVRNLGQISDPQVRSALAALVKALAGVHGEGLDGEDSAAENSNGSGLGHADDEAFADLLEDNASHAGAHGSNGRNGRNGGNGGGNHGAED